MQFIQSLAKSLLNEETKKDIAQRTPLGRKESLGKVIVSILEIYTVPTQEAVDKVFFAVSKENGGALEGNNQLASDKAARTYLTAQFGEIPREELQALVAAARAHATLK